MEKIRCPFNVTTQAQAAAIAALGDQDFVRKSSEENRRVMERAVSELTEMGIFVIPSQTNFIMADVKQDSRAVFEKLMAKGYIIRAGAAFGMDSFIRVTVGTGKEMSGLLTALKEVLDEG
jgi:histidinol-phosphate aminotransferase